ncbi:MAG: hypothetical protein OXC63_03135 [Aestuariivita sp.]|nr:hypothetical protein [Aestuariivita sp.]MCY4346056.1 hypothetical protein [Aestuariivita sp.]
MRASYFPYDQCTHQLCGSHFLRELAFVIEANGDVWADEMTTLRLETCHKINASETEFLTASTPRTLMSFLKPEGFGDSRIDRGLSGRVLSSKERLIKRRSVIR